MSLPKATQAMAYEQVTATREMERAFAVERDFMGGTPNVQGRTQRAPGSVIPISQAPSVPKPKPVIKVISDVADGTNWSRRTLDATTLAMMIALIQRTRNQMGTQVPLTKAMLMCFMFAHVQVIVPMHGCNPNDRTIGASKGHLAWMRHILPHTNKVNVRSMSVVPMSGDMCLATFVVSAKSADIDAVLTQLAIAVGGPLHFVNELASNSYTLFHWDTSGADHTPVPVMRAPLADNIWFGGAPTYQSLDRHGYRMEHTCKPFTVPVVAPTAMDVLIAILCPHGTSDFDVIKAMLRAFGLNKYTCADRFGKCVAHKWTGIWTVRCADVAKVLAAIKSIMPNPLDLEWYDAMTMTFGVLVDCVEIYFGADTEEYFTRILAKLVYTFGNVTQNEQSGRIFVERVEHALPDCVLSALQASKPTADIIAEQADDITMWNMILFQRQSANKILIAATDALVECITSMLDGAQCTPEDLYGAKCNNVRDVCHRALPFGVPDPENVARFYTDEIPAVVRKRIEVVQAEKKALAAKMQLTPA